MVLKTGGGLSSSLRYDVRIWQAVWDVMMFPDGKTAPGHMHGWVSRQVT